MKRFALFILLTTLMACGGTKYKTTITQAELEKFSFDKEYIYYESAAVAKFGYIEYEYYRGHKVLEISVEQIKPGLDDFTDKIVEYIRYKNPKAKVEVKIPQYPFQDEAE